MEDQLQDLEKLCERLGAPSQQARTMARQLWKRSEQIASERNIEQVEAMNHLLTLMIKGRQGIVSTETAPEKGSISPNPAKNQGLSQD